jgi:hypothetical protein
VSTSQVGLRIPSGGGVDVLISGSDHQFETPPSCNLDAEHDDAPLGYMGLSDILGSVLPPGPVARNVVDHLYLTKGDKPSTFSQAEKVVSWRHAMTEEISSIEDNGTWELVDLLTGQKLIGLKWVYKLKKDASGAMIKHKARLVARQLVQREGVDYDEVLALVARLDSVRLLLALAAQEGWLVHHLDVKSVFLNGELKEEVYVSQPPEFVRKCQKHKVYKLYKALYGLKQAPRA